MSVKKKLNYLSFSVCKICRSKIFERAVQLTWQVVCFNCDVFLFNVPLKITNTFNNRLNIVKYPQLSAVEALG